MYKLNFRELHVRMMLSLLCMCSCANTALASHQFHFDSDSLIIKGSAEAQDQRMPLISTDIGAATHPLKALVAEVSSEADKNGSDYENTLANNAQNANKTIEIYADNIDFKAYNAGVLLNGNPHHNAVAYVNIGEEYVRNENFIIEELEKTQPANYGIFIAYNGIANIYSDNIQIDAKRYGLGIYNFTKNNKLNINGGRLHITSQDVAVFAYGEDNTINIGGMLPKLYKMKQVVLSGKKGIWTPEGTVKVYAAESTIKGSEAAISTAPMGSSRGGNIDIHSNKLSINGDISNIGHGGIVNILSNSAQINGNITSSNNGVTVLELDNASPSVFYGAVHDSLGGQSNIVLNNGALWNVKAQSNLHTLVLGKGSVADLTKDQHSFSKLELNSLLGDLGCFVLDIDASKNVNNSDHIYIKGTHEGTHYIALHNTKAEENKDKADGTILASVGNEQGTFKVKPEEGKLSWETYTLEKKDSTADGYKTDWYLKSAKEEVVVPPTDAGNNQDSGAHTASVAGIMSVDSLNYHTWRTENDKLLQRTSNLRRNGDSVTGAWISTTSSKIGRDGTFGFKNKYNSYELGYDELAKQTSDALRYQGMSFDYVDGSSSYKNGSGANHGKALSFYSTVQYDSGHYLDLVFKLSHMDNDFCVIDTQGNIIGGGYDNMGVSISAEYGFKNSLKHGWYVEPQAQLTLGYLGGDDYRTSNDISVKQSGIKSAVGRLGFSFGRDISPVSAIYVNTSLLHEFGGSYDVVMSDGQNSLDIGDSFDDTWLEYGVGINLEMRPNSYFYLSAERSAGSNFKKDWQWNAGLYYRF